jgi:hypothetical protein
MNELKREMRSISCILAESRNQYHDYNESNLYQLIPGGHCASIISCVNMHFHLANNVSTGGRLKKAGEMQVQRCYINNNIILILIPITSNHYKYNQRINPWIQECLTTDYFENQTSLLSNVQDTIQDIDVL